MRTPFIYKLNMGTSTENELSAKYEPATCFRKDCRMFGVFVSRFLVILLPPEGAGLSATSPLFPIPFLSFRHGDGNLGILSSTPNKNWIQNVFI